MKLRDKDMRIFWSRAMRRTKDGGCTKYELMVLVMWSTNTSAPVNGREFSMHVKDIARATHLTEGHVRRAFEGLCRKGYLRRLPGKYANYSLILSSGGQMNVSLDAKFRFGDKLPDSKEFIPVLEGIAVYLRKPKGCLIVRREGKEWMVMACDDEDISNLSDDATKAHLIRLLIRADGIELNRQFNVGDIISRNSKLKDWREQIDGQEFAVFPRDPSGVLIAVEHKTGWSVVVCSDLPVPESSDDNRKRHLERLVKSSTYFKTKDDESNEVRC